MASSPPIRRVLRRGHVTCADQVLVVQPRLVTLARAHVDDPLGEARLRGLCVLGVRLPVRVRGMGCQIRLLSQNSAPRVDHFHGMRRQDGFCSCEQLGVTGLDVRGGFNLAQVFECERRRGNGIGAVGVPRRVVVSGHENILETFS